MTGNAKRSLFERLGGRIAERLIEWRPELVAAILRRRREAAAMVLNTPPAWPLRPAALPERIVGFEDLASLFWVSPLNRGALDLDLDEAALLFRSVGGLDAPRGVEVGRGTGAATLLLAAAVGQRGRMTSLDPAPDDDDAVRAALERTKLRERIGLVAEAVNEVTVQPDFDFVFFHGRDDYEALRLRHNRWIPGLRPEGLAIYQGMAAARSLAMIAAGSELVGLKLRAQPRRVLEPVAEAGSLAVWRRTQAAFTPLEPIMRPSASKKADGAR